ncbi:MAG: hypothetical protein O3A63_02485 [Proteobacteria bacterium]|nr:hypothetical protein [Pseudomonadota bacterium]
MKLAPQESGDLQLSLIKRRGGWPVSDLHLALEARPKTDVIREQLSLWSDLQSARQGRNTGPRTGLPRTGLPQAGPQMDLQEQTRDSWFFDDELSSSQASSSAPSPAGSSVHSPVQVTH